jgi:hypothetical protein
MSQAKTMHCLDNQCEKATSQRKQNVNREDKSETMICCDKNATLQRRRW